MDAEEDVSKDAHEHSLYNKLYNAASPHLLNLPLQSVKKGTGEGESFLGTELGARHQEMEGVKACW